ncbi:MAG: hypothetical protein WBX01_13845 [Nitrososphaeraceae archaeon]
MFITKVKLASELISIFAIITVTALIFIVSNSILSVAAQEMQNANQPNPVNVTVGQEVVWTNDDSQIHTATSGSGPNDPQLGEVFDSGIIGATFGQTGEIPSQMIGTVIVA